MYIHEGGGNWDFMSGTGVGVSVAKYLRLVNMFIHLPGSHAIETAPFCRWEHTFFITITTSLLCVHVRGMDGSFCAEGDGFARVVYDRWRLA